MSGQDVMKDIRGKMYEKGFKEGMWFGSITTGIFYCILHLLLIGRG
jgi:hypothetical protein